MKRNLSLLLGLFLFYAVARVALSQPAIARPRELADTSAYMRISSQSLFERDFWGSSRPFVFPLVLKVARQDFSVTASFQLAFSIIAWGLVAMLVSSFLRDRWVVVAGFCLLLVLSLVPHLAGWDFTMMTESLSVSSFVLFVAAGLWVLQDWKAPRVAAFIIAGLFLAFTRDTNAYLLLMLAGLLLVAVLLRWAAPRTLLLVGAFAGIFVLSSITADLGGRWIFPLINITGRRILRNPQAIAFFEKSCAMPVTPALLSMENEFANGDDRAFYTDPELEGFRLWLGSEGRSCYLRWLAADWTESFSAPLAEFWQLIQFSRVGNYFSRAYDPIVPLVLEPFLYPARLALSISMFTTFAALVALARKSWRQSRLWAAFILLCLPVFPHFFITWHGDAMAPERHALSVGLELVLAFWLLIFLLLDGMFQGGEARGIPAEPQGPRSV